MQSSHTLKRLNHNAEIQMFTPYVSIKDAIQPELKNIDIDT